MLHFRRKAIKLWQCIMYCFQHYFCLGGYLKLGLKALCNDVHDAHILVQLDNVTGVTYINNMGSTHSVLCSKVARDIWLWCIDRNIWLTETHIPGKWLELIEILNSEPSTTEWMLDPNVFQRRVI